jgi:hypothetical protein
MPNIAPNTVAMAADRAMVHFKRRAEQLAYRKDPAKWAKDRLGLYMWSKQRGIAEAIVTNHKVAVKSGHGIGKSFLAAILVLWWIDTHIGEDVLVVTTAPTKSQVTGIVWEYIRKLHLENNRKNDRLHKFIGTISEQAEWKDDDRSIIAFGVKPADNNNAGFAGRHYDHTLVLLDEACGVKADLFMSAEAITTTDTCRILAIGNPVDPNTEFGNIFLGNGGRGLDDWDKHTISTLDNPNFTGEDVPASMRNSLTSKAKVDGWRQKWGEDSNEWRIRVTGEFPESSNSKMFPLHLLYQGINTVMVPGETTRCTLGVDVARFGDDSSTVIRYHDGDTSIEGKWNGLNTVQVAQKVHELAVRLNARSVRVDGTGVGSGVVDQLRVLSLNHDYLVIEMVGSASSPDFKKYLNARAWWHQNVYDLLAAGQLHLPDTTNDPEATQLFEEMRELEKKYNVTWGSLQIESKDDMRRRKVSSPDLSDALMYACAPLPEDSELGYLGPGDMTYYDPMEDDEYSRGWVIAPF